MRIDPDTNTRFVPCRDCGAEVREPLTVNDPLTGEAIATEASPNTRCAPCGFAAMAADLAPQRSEGPVAAFATTPDGPVLVADFADWEAAEEWARGELEAYWLEDDETLADTAWELDSPSVFAELTEFGVTFESR